MVNKQQLALLGGVPCINHQFPDYNSIGHREIESATHVLKSGKLSQFVGSSGEFFFGGNSVKSMESAWSEFFKTSFAVSSNSWTSGLWLAIGALGLEPGSEVIVSSWTMAATATTILHWNLVPVFADVDEASFNLNPLDVENRITKRTRAIVSPDIFGQSADIESLKIICEKYDLKLVSDTAQSPGAKRNGYFAGTGSDIGGFSLNYHKHIHSGEGGVAVTNSPELANRMQLLRNHGEVVVGQNPDLESQYGILGMNMRLGEIESAIAEVQLTALNQAIASRRSGAQLFSSLISDLPGIAIPQLVPGNDHVYYVYGMKFDCNLLGVDRRTLVRALKAEGVPAIQEGYQNIHRLPLFTKELTYKSNPLPYSLLPKKRRRELSETQLPVAERLHLSEFVGINWCAKEFIESEVRLLASAFEKVLTNLDPLRES
jgi:dTDP-4-amino-4,6-dideoxygalactose transaminase